MNNKILATNITKDLGLPVYAAATTGNIICVDRSLLPAKNRSRYVDHYLLYMSKEKASHIGTIAVEGFEKLTIEQQLIIVYLMYNYETKIVKNCLKVGNYYISGYTHKGVI